MIKRKEWFSKNKCRIMIYVVALIGLVVMWRYAGLRSLWMDDIAQINICGQEDFFKALLKSDNNPPLSHFITYLWLRIAPYGTNWIKLPGIIFVVGGSLFCAETGRKLYGDLCGLIICAFAVSSSSIVEAAAYVVRPYGLLFGLMSVVLYCYVQRNLHEFRWNRVILLGIGMTGAVYTHYFAVLAVFAMFCFDCYLVIKKKISWKCLISYLIAGGAFLPWFIYTAQNYYEKLQTFWPSVPTIYNVISTIRSLLGNNGFSFSLFVIIVIGLILLRISKKEFDIREEIVFSFLLQIVIVLLIPYVYSRYVNPNGSIYVDRYFVTIAPCIFLIMGIGVNSICEYLNTKLKIEVLLNVLCISLCISALYNNFSSLYETQSQKLEPYEEMADYIMEQEDIYNDNVAIYNSGYSMQKGWDYYLTHNGEREGKEAFYNREINDIKVLDGIDRLYVCELHKGINATTGAILKEYFELTYKDEESGVWIYDRIQ
ncbi:MAG: glycosyltransferase family 39 protein [Bacteroides sp.]|nr:glycosyltransferase family 39 protein [Bacteroides sp.]MCM1548417.1 glycosyltransferase family 39 protein [Clostridium sp.]